jgi:hypothetical protein
MGKSIRRRTAQKKWLQKQLRRKQQTATEPEEATLEKSQSQKPLEQKILCN